MKFSKLIKKCFLLLISVFFLLLVPMSIYAEGEIPPLMKVPTNIVSLCTTLPTVTYNQRSDLLDADVYNALLLNVFDDQQQPIPFTAHDITLNYLRQIGDQDITVTYNGTDVYASSQMTATIRILDNNKKEDSHLVLAANSPNVPFNDNPALLTQEIYSALNIQLMDTNNKAISFTPNDIKLDFNPVRGQQNVTVTYQGNDKYSPCTAVAFVNIMDKLASKTTVTSDTPSIDYSTDANALDQKVYTSMGIKVQDINGNSIPFDASNIKLSYNRAVGNQDVTVTYQGNGSYLGSTTTGHIKLVGQPPVNTNTTVVLSPKPDPVKFTNTPQDLDAAVYKDLNIQVLDSSNKNIKFAPSDIEISYNHAPGKQPVTVVYKGDATHQRSTATQTVTITDIKKARLILAANPPQINYNKDAAKLDDNVYQGLNIQLVDENNNKIDFKKDDIQLTFNHGVGTQTVKVQYKGNPDTQPTEATATVVIVDEAKQAFDQELIIWGSIAFIVIVLLVAGISIYRSKKRKEN
ncbi:MAG: hypothetical protein ACRCU3_02080 [Eubacteriaceae bacterium]